MEAAKEKSLLETILEQIKIIVVIIPIIILLFFFIIFSLYIYI